MGKLVYSTLMSLDGYIEDETGNFDWAEPQEDVHRYVNSLEAQSSAALYGKNLYEIMTFWENLPDLESPPEYIQDYARIWKRMRKIVFSSTLKHVDTTNTVLERRFAKADIEKIKKEEKGIIGIGGANLASQAMALGLLDEINLFVFPVIVGNGKPWITAESKINLEKLETKEFLNGVFMVSYAVKGR